MTAARTDRTNTIEIVRTPTRMVAVPAGRGIWIGQDLLAPPTAPVTGDVVVRLHRGDVSSDNVVIPVRQEGIPTTALAETTVTVSPDSVVYTFPAGATFTNQAVATLRAAVDSDGTPGAGTWSLLAAPTGYSLDISDLDCVVRYTGARPTETASFLVQYNVAGSDDATGDGDSAAITTGIVAPPQRTDATIATITRSNLESFTQNITQLFSGSIDSYQVISSNVQATTVVLDAQNRAAFSPVADGTSTITVIAFNAGGTAQYEFEVIFDILQQPVITWPAANFNAANGRYEFTTATSATTVPLGTLLPTVSAPSGTVGAVSFDVSSVLAGVVDWLSNGALSLAAGAATSDRQYVGALIVNVEATSTVRFASFERDIFIEVSSAAVPVVPPARNPAFVPTGGLTRTVRVGEFFDIDWTGAFADPNTPVVPVVQNEEIINVVLRTGDVTRCTGVRVGTTTFTVSGVWVVRVQVLAATAALTPTTSAWYQRQNDGTYAAVSSLSLSLEENSARANLLAANPLFLTFTELATRTITYQERPALAGLDVLGATTPQAINLPGGGSAQAIQVSLFADGSQFDYEEQSSYALTLLAEADTDTIGNTTYEAHTAQLPIALAITDVFEPTAAPNFNADDASVNLPSGTDGSTTGFSLGTFDAGQGATYTISESLRSIFAVDSGGDLTYTGGAAAAIVGNSWTVVITATNSLGSDTIEVLVTVKAVVVLTFMPPAIDWKLPVGTTEEFVLGSITVISTSNDRAGLPPLPSLTPEGDDAQFIKIVPTSHNVFQVSYTGEAASLSTSDLDFSLKADSAENGLCLAATASISASVPAVPATPIFSDPSYVFELTDGTDPPPSVVVGLPTATHAPGETQRWRIISTQTGMRLFTINAADGAISYDGPDAASRSAVPSYTLTLGVVNIDGSKESIEATQDATINVVEAYTAPVANGSWSPGANWTKAADGSFHGTVRTGAANSVSVDISVGATGPWTIMSGRTATYRNQTIPSPPTHYAITRSDGIFNIRGTSVGSETLYLFMSDGRTEEQLVFHVQVVAATTTLPSSATWYTDGAGLSYDVVDAKGINISFPEGQSSPVSRNIYVTYTEIDNRTNGTLAEPTQNGFDIVEGGILRRQITIGSQQVWVDAYQVNVNPQMFDYETQNRYDLTATMNVPQATVGSTTYAAVHKPIEIHLNVGNVNEPPDRTSQAAPANFELRRRGNIIDYSLNGYWVSEDNPDANNLSFRLVQTVVGASGGQSTNAADYLSALLIGNTFQASAGTGATLTPSGVSIRFDIYCREASTGVENPTPLTFSCTEVHSRALEDSALTWGSSVPARLEFSVPENQTLPYLLRNDIIAESTVVDMSAVAGAISYSLREPTFWIERNPDFVWDGTISLAAGGTKVYDMTNAFIIRGTEAAGKDWTLAQRVTHSNVLTIAVSGKTATVTASNSLTAADNTNFYLAGSDGDFVEEYTGYADVAAATAFSAKTLSAAPTLIHSQNQDGGALTAGTDYNLTGIGETAANPLTFALNSPSSFPEFEFFFSADDFFQTTRAGADITLTAVAPATLGTQSPSYFENPAAFYAVFSGFGDVATGDLNVFCIAPQLWIASERTSGLSGTLTLTGSDGTDTATKTLYVRVEAM